MATSVGVLLRVTLEVDFHALRKEALATDGTAAANDGASVYRLHAGTKAKLLLPRAFGGLIGPFGLGHGLVGW